jgi:hypothetical protein
MTMDAASPPKPAVWLSPTRFAHWPAWPARLILAVMLLLIAAPQPDMSGMRKLPAHVTPDYTLYREIVERMTAGQGYYAAADAVLRANGKATTPALVFREPAEAMVLTVLRTDAVRQGVMEALALAALVALIGAIEQAGLSLVHRIVAITLVSTALLNATFGFAPYMHEIWASLLMFLSLCLYRPGRWAPSVILGVAACLVRELCLPFLLAMGAFAVFERRPREAAGWLVGASAFGVLFAIHLAFAHAQARPGDASGPSWFAMGGLPFLLGIAHWNPVLLIAPARVVAIFLCLSVIGLAGATSPWVQRIALIVIGYLVAFCFVGRSDNHYWGMLIAPMLPLGLALAPAAVADLVRAAVSFAPAAAKVTEPRGARN